MFFLSNRNKLSEAQEKCGDVSGRLSITSSKAFRDSNTFEINYRVLVAVLMLLSM